MHWVRGSNYPIVFFRTTFRGKDNPLFWSNSKFCGLSGGRKSSGVSLPTNGKKEFRQAHPLTTLTKFPARKFIGETAEWYFRATWYFSDSTIYFLWEPKNIRQNWRPGSSRCASLREDFVLWLTAILSPVKRKSSLSRIFWTARRQRLRGSFLMKQRSSMIMESFVWSGSCETKQSKVRK